MTDISAELKIQRHIMMGMLTEQAIDDDDNIDLSTSKGIEECWDIAGSYTGIFSDCVGDVQDVTEEFRESGESTSLKCTEYSRHYECERVAEKLSCGAFVSWLYWTGGGKHGEPEAIDWMNEAVEVDCVEEEKLVVVRSYSERAND